MERKENIQIKFLILYRCKEVKIMEKNKKSDGEEEKKENAQDQSEKDDADSDVGVPAEKKNLVEQAKIENDRREKLLEEEKVLQERKERLHAEQLVGRRAGMSAPEKKKEITDVEYAENLQKGISNPLKEDGFIK